MLINIGRTYVRAEDIRMITKVEAGQEEDKMYGISVITRSINFNHMCEGSTARDELIEEIRKQIDSGDEELAEIRKQLANINGRINQADRKLAEIRKVLKEERDEKQDT